MRGRRAGLAQVMLALLAACATPVADSPAPPADTDLALPEWDGAQAAPSWSPAEVEAVVAAALAIGLPDPIVINEHFQVAMSGADAGCPPSSSESGGTGFSIPQSSCRSEAGYNYYGVGDYLEDADGDPTTDDWMMGICSFEITFPDGNVFTCGGTYGYSSTVTTSGVTFTAFDDAVVTWPDGPAWAGANAGAAYSVEGELVGDHITYELVGGLLVEGTAVFFDRLAWDSEACDGLPELELRVRDPNGYWYSVATGTGCDPCGALLWDGASLGDVCVDSTTAASTLGLSLGSP